LFSFGFACPGTNQPAADPFSLFVLVVTAVEYTDDVVKELALGPESA
jgi:hypothetical protein